MDYETEIVRNIYLLSKIVRIDSVNNLKLRSHIYHHNIRNTTLHTIFHVLFLFICLNFSNKSKIKCETNAAAISGGMSHTMFPVISVSILLYNLKKMFFSTFQQISMSSCEFLKDIFGAEPRESKNSIQFKCSKMGQYFKVSRVQISAKLRIKSEKADA